MTSESAAGIVAGDDAEPMIWGVEDRAIDLGWGRFDDDAWEESHLATPAARNRRVELAAEATVRDAIGKGADHAGG